MERLTRFARVITFDRRGSGLSDPLLGAPTLEEQMDDVLAVLDAVGSERAAMVGTLEGGPMAALFAASHPDRVALILYATFARATWAPDYDFAWSARSAPAHGPGGRALGRGPRRERRGAQPHEGSSTSSGRPGSSAWRPAQGPSSGSST